MTAIIEAISFNSWAYMFFMGGIVAAIYVVLFLITKSYINSHKREEAK